VNCTSTLAVVAGYWGRIGQGQLVGLGIIEYVGLLLLDLLLVLRDFLGEILGGFAGPDFLPLDVVTDKNISQRVGDLLRQKRIGVAISNDDEISLRNRVDNQICRNGVGKPRWIIHPRRCNHRVVSHQSGRSVARLSRRLHDLIAREDSLQ
jgi:hypothetical protein